MLSQTSPYRGEKAECSELVMALAQSEAEAKPLGSKLLQLRAMLQRVKDWLRGWLESIFRELAGLLRGFS